MSDGELRAVLRHDETEVEFSGNYEDVWRSINKYLSEIYPPIEAVKKLIGAIDVNLLMEKLEGLVEIREGMINVLEDTGAKRKILLCLAGAHVGKILGLLERDKLTPKEIASYTGLNEKVTRARLSELKKAGLVIKYGEGLYGFTKASIKELFGEEP